MRFTWFVLAFTIAWAITTLAAAQESSDDTRARLHFEAGRSYFEEGNYEQALDEFSRAYDLSHRPPLLVNMSNCQERLGRWREAADSLERFVGTLPEGDEQRATMQRRIENLRARADQHDAEERARLEREAQEAQASAATTTSSSSTTEPASDGLLVPSLIAFGVGAAALIAWGTLGGLALAEESNVANGCGATRSCTPAQVQAMDDLALGADISMAIGLAAVATGAVLIIVAPPHGPITRESAAVAPFGSRDGAGLVVRGSF